MISIVTKVLFVCILFTQADVSNISLNPYEQHEFVFSQVKNDYAFIRCNDI